MKHLILCFFYEYTVGGKLLKNPEKHRKQKNPG